MEPKQTQTYRLTEEGGDAPLAVASEVERSWLNGMERSRVEWNEIDRSGAQSSGIDRSFEASGDGLLHHNALCTICHTKL